MKMKNFITLKNIWIFTVLSLIVWFVFVEAREINNTKTALNFQDEGVDEHFVAHLNDKLSNLTKRVDSLYATIFRLKQRERKRKKVLARLQSYVQRLDGIMQNDNSNLEIKNFCGAWIKRHRKKVLAAPYIVQLTPWKIRIYWKKLEKVDNCTEYFLIRYWKSTEPNDIRFSEKFIKNDKTSLDIKVDPGVLYTFQKITAYNIKEKLGTSSVKDKTRKSDLKFKRSNIAAHQTVVNQPRGIVREVTLRKEKYQEYGLTFRFNRSDGLVEIADIIPGSPADKSGRICIGDKIWAINFKRMYGKRLNTLKVVKKLIKVFASSITVNLISKQFNGCKVFDSKKTSESFTTTQKPFEYATVTAFATSTIPQINSFKFPKFLQRNVTGNQSVRVSKVELCKSGLSIVTNDGNSSIAYGGWYKQNLFRDYRLHSYDSRGNRVLINDKNFFLSKNKDDIWMISEGIQTSTTNGKGGIRNVYCKNVSSPELCKEKNRWEYFDENQMWKIDKTILIQCII